MGKKIQIILVDDHKLFATGIEKLLSGIDDFKIIGVYHNGNEAFEALKSNKVDLLLTDIKMPGMNGLELLQNIKKKRWKVKTIVLSMYEEEEIFQKCVKHGAHAYVLKNADQDELIYTIREVMEDRYVHNFEHVLRQAEDNEFDQFDHFKLTVKLSKREMEILKLIAGGNSNKDIAEILHLSVYTVETHRKNLYMKLEVSSVAELINKAREMDIV
ncbi:MAG: response regulator transcription factor [Cyclobacteriaceae bacterium]